MLHPTEPRSWRLALGETTLPDPALLIRRVLNGQDPEREPRLPLKKIRAAAAVPGARGRN